MRDRRERERERERDRRESERGLRLLEDLELSVRAEMRDVIYSSGHLAKMAPMSA